MHEYISTYTLYVWIDTVYVLYSERGAVGYQI